MDGLPSSDATISGGVPLRVSRLGKRLVLSALLRVPLNALLGLLVLFGAARSYSRTLADQGSWAALGGWTLVSVYGLVGLVGGALIGFGGALLRTAQTFEEELRLGLQQLPSHRFEGHLPSLPLSQARVQYQQAFDGMIASTIGRLPLPSFVTAFIEGQLQESILDDFLADCEQRGATTVGFPEFQSWMLSRGLALAMAPVYAQLRWWRILIFGLLGILAVGILLLGLLTT